MGGFLNKIWQEKCPNCGERHVFEQGSNVFLLKIPRMKDACANCCFRFEKEPGYFTGAMYVSYGLCVAEMVGVVLIGLLLGFSFDQMLYPLILTIVAFWRFNFKKSRLIWMHMF